MNEDQTQIRQLLGDLAEAIQRKDAARAVAPYATTNVMYVLEPPLQSRTEGGTSAPGGGEAGVQAWFDTWDGPMGYDRRDVEIFAEGDLAFSYGLVHLTGTKVGGGAEDLWFRETLGFRRIDGEWRIVHQHQSVPFMMDGSSRAALDLKP